MKQDADFFVGYLPMPLALKRAIKLIVAALFGLVAGLAVAISVSQHGFAHSSFEFGQVRRFEGTVMERPYPVLLVPRTGNPAGRVPFSVYALVGQFKHGADPDVRGLDSKNVSLEGQLIYRDGLTMVEVKPGSIHLDPFGTTIGGISLKNLGRVTVTGELVDAKCYLGVMNPGVGKVHRDCAARCVSGGVPLAIVTRGPQQLSEVFYVRAVASNSVPDKLLQHVGETATVSGQAVQLGDQRFLLVE